MRGGSRYGARRPGRRGRCEHKLAIHLQKLAGGLIGRECARRRSRQNAVQDYGMLFRGWLSPLDVSGITVSSA